jgi:B-cell receptor-associated protein 31
MYLTGFTLFLSLILNRTYGLILDVLRLEEKVKMYEGSPDAGGKDGEKLDGKYRADQIGQLKRELEKKDKEITAMKKQSEGLQKEYDELSVKFNQTNPGTGYKKSN